MRGSIRLKAENRWELRVYVGADPDTGRKRWVSRSVRGSRREAEAELAVLVGEVERPRRRAVDTTVGELFDRWLAEASPAWAPNTARETASVIRAHLGPRFGHLAIGALTTADIDGFYAELRAHGGRDGRRLSDGTVRRIHGVLHRALAQAVRWGWIWINPAEHATPPIAEHREIHSPPIDAVVRLLAATAGEPGLHAWFCLAVSSGARRGQLCGLRWHDIDLTRGTVAFCRAIAEVPDGLVVVPTKNRRRHRVEIDDTTLAVLRCHRRDAERRADAAGSTVTQDGFVFSHDADGVSPWRPNWVTQRFIRLRPEVGLVGYRLHDLRHFMATEMLAAGVPIPIVAARLAHARASTTLNVYAHAVPGGDRNAANHLADLLKRSAS